MHPFSENPAETLSAVGESALIRMLRNWLGPVSPQAPAGIGDDCAVLPAGGLAANQHPLVTVDSVVYGHHFDSRASGYEAGAKLVKRNLSDIAAMAGTPTTAVLALMLPANLRIDWLEDFYHGIRACCERYEVSLIGGDITSGANSQFGAFWTQHGISRTPVLRSGSEAGDALYVTGELGGSILGHHLHFLPRLDEARWLAEKQVVRAMIDITDGIAKDLPALLPTGVNAVLDERAIPIADAAREMANGDTAAALAAAFCDGEDYELLFTVPPWIPAEALLSRWQERFECPLTKIGQLSPSPASSTAGRILSLQTGKPLTFVQGGFQHLQSQ